MNVKGPEFDSAKARWSPVGVVWSAMVTTRSGST
jgi:hypothetical protein